ncbi:MAG: rod shape-determining protein RodA [Actinomycetota bacterium]
MDLTLLACALSLSVLGAVFIGSASEARLVAEGQDPALLFKRQIIFLCIALGVFVATTLIDYRQGRAAAPVVYGVAILLLLVVLTPLGHTALGAQRWINLGAFQVQPSELMKVVLIICLSAALATERAIAEQGPRKIALGLGIVAFPALLIFRQPDLGTVMVLLAIVFALLLISGAQMRWLALAVVAGIAMLALAVQIGVLKEYQIARLESFLDANKGSSSANYNLAQSKIAIGSGGLTGKGIGKGTQTNLKYVPSQHTDFVFTAIGEEWGFVGGSLVLGLFALLLWRALRIALLSKDLLGTLMASGVAAMFAFQIFVNIGMTMGIMPITGIPLPFVSYGGSSLITNFTAVGILMNIHMRRFV